LAKRGIFRGTRQAGRRLDDTEEEMLHMLALSQFEAFNAIYEKKFPGTKPVRTTVRADLVAGMLVEITAVARASERVTREPIGRP
jgi:hypothetical protein